MQPDNLGVSPEDDDGPLPLVVPEDEPQARSLYPDVQDPGVPVGYSHVPGGTVAISYKKSSHSAEEARTKLESRTQELAWVDPNLYWTPTHWFFRVKKKDNKGGV